MAQKSYFFNSAPGDRRTYQAADFARYFGSVLTSGIMPNPETGDIAALTPGEYGLNTRMYANLVLGLQVVMGNAIIRGYRYELDSPHDITFRPQSSGDVGYDRIDRIVLRLDLSNHKRSIELAVVEGNTAINPVPPALTRNYNVYELSLARVRVRAGYSFIDESDVVDERADETVCGFANSLITVPTSVFQQQFDSWFENYQTSAAEDFSNWTEYQKLDVATWVNHFKDEVMDANDEYQTWVNALKASTSADTVAWQNSRKAQFDAWQNVEQRDFNAWVDGLKDNLGEAVAEDIKLEVEAARVDGETGDFFVNIGARLDEINTNPTVRSKKSETPNLGQELISTATAVTLGTGWSGDAINGFTHVAEQTEPLVFDISQLVPNANYQVEVLVTNPAVNDNGQSDYWVSLGGSPEFETYKGQSVTRHVWGIKAVQGTQLVFRPWTGYSGKLTISVKQILSVVPFNAQYKDSETNTNFEMRLSKNAVDSIYLGRNSGQYANEFAQQNVTLGNRAGQSITSAFWNVLLGYDAGRDLTTGSRCVFIGRIAGEQSTTAHRCIAIGSFALRSNKSGHNIIAIGADANYNNIDGHSIIAIGTVSLDRNTSAVDTIAIGYRAGGWTEGGTDNFYFGRDAGLRTKTSFNIMFGREAGFWNSTGTGVIAIGHHAARMNPSGNYNTLVGFEVMKNGNAGGSVTAMGMRALLENQANNNTAVGAQSGIKITTGANNTLMGAYAGGVNTTGGDNTILGYRAAAAGVAGKIERNVVIGATAGLNMTEGADFNVILGATAAGLLQTGKRNILLGYGVNVPNTFTSDYLNIGGVITSDMPSKVVSMHKLKLTDLPTTQPAESGMIWNDGGTLKVA